MIDSNDRDKLYITNCQAYFGETAAILFKYFVTSFRPIRLYLTTFFIAKKNRYTQKKWAVSCNLSCQPVRAGKYLAFLCILT